MHFPTLHGGFYKECFLEIRYARFSDIKPSSIHRTEVQGESLDTVLVRGGISCTSAFIGPRRGTNPKRASPARTLSLGNERTPSSQHALLASAEYNPVSCVEVLLTAEVSELGARAVPTAVWFCYLGQDAMLKAEFPYLEEGNRTAISIVSQIR